MTGGEGEVNVISLFNFVRPKAILVEKSVAVVFYYYHYVGVSQHLGSWL